MNNHRHKEQQGADRDPEIADSRERILRAAIAEFHKYGGAGARVDRIASEAGVNKALIYYYYNSKENLYEEAIKSYLGGVLSAILFRIDDSDDMEGTLNGIAEQYRDLFLTQPEAPRMLLRELANPESTLVPRLAKMIRESGIAPRIRKRLEDGIASGDLRQVDPRQAVVSFITMNLGYYLMSPLINRVFAVENYEGFIMERKEAVVDLFLNGVKAR